MAVADVLKMIEENDVKFVDLRFTDTRGKEQRDFTIPAHVLTEDAEEWFEHESRVWRFFDCRLERDPSFRHAADGRPSNGQYRPVL